MNGQKIVEMLIAVLIGGLLAKLPDLIALRQQGPATVRKIIAEAEKINAETADELAQVVSLLATTYKEMVESLKEQARASENAVDTIKKEREHERAISARLIEENQTLAQHNRRLTVELSIARKTEPTEKGDQ